MDKTGRNGLRVGDLNRSDFKECYQALNRKHAQLLQIYPEVEFDLLQEEAQWMESVDFIRQLPQVDGEYFINQALAEGKRILAEGAQGSMLDIDYGTYPFVTSSNTITAGVCTGLGVAPSKIGEVIGITKAYCTRVGAGPFPTELNDEDGELLRKEGKEFGATTGRPRRCGWIDIPQLKYTIMLNGVTQLAVTKIDVLNIFQAIKIGTSYSVDGQQSNSLPYDICSVDITPNYQAFAGWQSSLEGVQNYEDLPAAAKQYLTELERVLEVPVTMVSTGPDRKKLIDRVGE